ncbi:MAG: alpha/beta hydrolase [Alphaproteobacteria bacterium]|nr:alpha/beta hydrolase [Alphaproteobacteria bacterium]
MADVFFNGPAGRIEGKYFQSSDQKAPVALVLHPHPLYGGSMNNKVVYAIYKALLRQNMSVLRINFRGVGKSQGEYDGGVGELTDAATAMDWLQSKNPLADKFWISGFSFGAWIAMQLIMRRPEINHFVSVSPPVNKFDFSFFAPCPVPGLIVQGNQDSIVTEADVMNFADKLSKQKIRVEYRQIDGADHFYREKIIDLENVISEYIENIHKQGEASGGSSRKSKKTNQMLLG